MISPWSHLTYSTRSSLSNCLYITHLFELEFHQDPKQSSLIFLFLCVSLSFSPCHWLVEDAGELSCRMSYLVDLSVAQSWCLTWSSSGHSFYQPEVSSKGLIQARFRFLQGYGVVSVTVRHSTSSILSGSSTSMVLTLEFRYASPDLHFLINLLSNGFHISFKYLLYKYLSGLRLSTFPIWDTGV